MTPFPSQQKKTLILFYIFFGLFLFNCNSFLLTEILKVFNLRFSIFIFWKIDICQLFDLFVLAFGMVRYLISLLRLNWNWHGVIVIGSAIYNKLGKGTVKHLWSILHVVIIQRENCRQCNLLTKNSIEHLIKFSFK